MDTAETTRSQESCSVNSGRPNDAQTVSARRLKKREVDRRCQREARERKRSRIAHLESLVVGLRQQDASGQVTALLRQLSRVEEERNLATKTLKDIQQLMVQRLTKDRAQDNGIVEVQVIPEGAKLGGHSTTNTTGEYTPVLGHAQPTLLNVEAMPADIFQRTSFITMTPNGELSAYPERSSSETVYQSGSHWTDQPLVQSSSTGSQTNARSSGIYDWVNPQPSCCCHAHMDRQPGQQAAWQGNFWKFICDVLSERFDWPEDVQPADDVDSEDVLIRAMLQGWDMVANRAPLHPSLQMLRRIDEATFRPIAKIERLAMLRAMHLLLQFHTQPTAERYKRLPSWYLYRPSQHIPHTYAIDYWAWPPFRQRFISNEDTYCGNEFFHMYQSQLRLLWPFEFRDCYTHDLESDLYRPSLLFDERINDVKCWTMGYDFFQRFPELCSDIPVAVGKVPKALRPAIRQMEKRSFSPTSTSSSSATQSTRIAVVDEGERQEQEQEQNPDEQADPYGAASSRTFMAYEGLLQPHLTHSRNEQAYTFSLPIHGYDFQQPVLDHSFSSCHGWYNFQGVDFDASFLGTTTGDAPWFPITSGAAVAGGLQGSRDVLGFP